MSFQPIVPLSGYSGWRFLQRTMESQTDAFNASVPVKRATDNFREKIGQITTAEQLVADRQLLQVALGAFGLDEDINNKYFIQKILEEGTFEDDALANKLADPRYAQFSAAFGFGNFDVPSTALSDFADDIVDRYERNQFVLAVGEQNGDMRFALNLETALTDVLEQTDNADAQWFSIMGNPPLRRVIEAAVGLPTTFARIDVDQQLEVFRERSQSVFGTDKVSELLEPENQEKMIRLFLVRSQIESTSVTSSRSIALTLLQA